MKDGQVYSLMPYNSTNIDAAIANAYFIGKTLCPTAFSDVDPTQKANGIYQALLGKALYAEMAEKFGGFGELKFGD